MTHNSILVFIPTYNERENVEKLYNKIKKLPYKLDILFCDDNSPDGTGKILDELADKDATVKVLHRPGKNGLGTAHKEGFLYAKSHHYNYLITMDADLTHDPNYIPTMMQKKHKADIVIGSRYAQGGQMKGWHAVRLPFTHFWRTMIKYGLGLPYDATGAFRLYNVDVLQEEIHKKIQSQGFSFCMESLYHFTRHGAKIAEVPIEAHSRVHGASKLSIKIMHEVATQFCKLVWNRISTRKKYTLKKRLV